MGQNQEIEIDVSENMEPGSSSNEENGIKRRGPSPESKLSDTDSTSGDNDRTTLLRSERRPRSNLSMRAQSKKNYPSEWWKTLVMLLYTLFCLSMMTIIETIVHDHVPLQNETEPLRDIAWNLTAKWPFFTQTGIHACFRATEIIGIILMSLVGVHILTHQHTSVILRRFFFHFGTVYLYRVVTISVTILPVPKLPNGHCMPPTDGSLQQIFARSFGQLVGGGMDMTGNNMCGDYLYSGHTCVITSAALFIFEYSPKRWWIYHYLVQIVAIIGVLCILVAHEHYTIDVIIAYYVCTNHFWSYHTLASSQDLKNLATSSEKVPLSRVWWWRIFVFMEGAVSSPLPRVHHNPLLKIKRLISHRITNSQQPSFSPL